MALCPVPQQGEPQLPIFCLGQLQENYLASCLLCQEKGQPPLGLHPWAAGLVGGEGLGIARVGDLGKLVFAFHPLGCCVSPWACCLA